jgi:hypothetical protein
MRAIPVEHAIVVREPRAQMTGSQQEYGHIEALQAVISFPVEIDGENSYENLHASFVEGDSYKLRNSPFYAYGVSFNDIVSVRECSGRLLFNSVTKRGGHSTYRVKIPPDRNEEYFLRHWNFLASLGCSYESSSANPKMIFSIDIPPAADVSSVYEFLDNMENEKVWEFEEVYYYDPGN